MQTPIRVLVVDDDPDIATGTCRVLGRAGYVTNMVHTGAGARDAVTALLPDLVLLDRSLPDGDGLDVCRWIKAAPDLADVFVIIASGTDTHQDDQISGLESGADGYLSRPITNREVLARVEAFARIARITRALRAEVARRRQLEEQLESRVAARTAELVRANAGLERARQGLASANEDLSRDSLERQQLRGHLAQVQKMESVGRLAGGVAHDFNNMLGVILGHTELALGRLDPASPAAGDLTEIRAAAARSADLVRQLLAFARKQTVAPQVLTLDEAVDGMLTMLRRLLGEDVELVWEPSTDPAVVRIDPTQLTQLLTNLCVNARDAIAGGGRLTISTGTAVLGPERCQGHDNLTPGPFVRLTVADTGCGMTPDVIEHIFEPFFTTKESGHGTGLGLATVYGVVRQNAGLIEVTSTVGKGTTFDVFLPQYVGDVSAEPETAVATAGGLRRGTETILVVEDEAAILGLVRTLLERLGYTVVTAATPREAIALVKANGHRIDLLVTDVVMPEMNGRMLAAELTALRPHLKTLYMSGYSPSVLAPHGVTAEGPNFIEKPFAMSAFAARLRSAIDGH
jgi:signal transduction histidine kinase